MFKIYVTGTSGFVGQNLWRYLIKNEFELHALQLRGAFDNNMLGKADVVVHLAGKSHDLKNVSHPDDYYQVNYELTKKLYAIFLESDVKKFIFVSSVKAVSDHPGTPLTEDHLPSPFTNYGKSKLMAEEYIQNQSLPPGKSFYILRPCMIHGPGNKGNLNLLYQLARWGVPYPLGAFDNARSFLSVENLCFVVKELAERNDIPSGIYNVADDIPLSTNRVIQIMSEKLSKKVRLWKIRKGLIKAIARIGDILPFPLNSERLQKLTESYVVSNFKLKSALNKPLPLTSEEGLRRTILSFIHNC